LNDEVSDSALPAARFRGHKFTPAEVGVYIEKTWIPAFAGMTNVVSATGTNYNKL